MINVFILDCKKEIDDFVQQTIDIDLPVISMPTLMRRVMNVLRVEDLGMFSKMALYQAARDYIVQRDQCILDEFFGNDEMDRLYSALLKLADAIRIKLRHHHAYVNGQFPFTFQKFMHNGTFYLTRRDQASTIAHHPRHTGGGAGIA